MMHLGENVGLAVTLDTFRKRTSWVQEVVLVGIRLFPLIHQNICHSTFTCNLTGRNLNAVWLFGSLFSPGNDKVLVLPQTTPQPVFWYCMMPSLGRECHFFASSTSSSSSSSPQLSWNPGLSFKSLKMIPRLHFSRVQPDFQSPAESCCNCLLCLLPHLAPYVFVCLLALICHVGIFLMRLHMFVLVTRQTWCSAAHRHAFVTLPADLCVSS